MADDADAPKPKKSKKKLILIGVGALVLGGGGVGAGIWAAGGSGTKHAEVVRPKLVPREGTHADPEAGGEDGSKPFDRKLYKATYTDLPKAFTSNLRDSDAVVQMSMGAATYFDSRVTDAIKENDGPIRSAVLLVLSEQDADAIGTPAGKKALQKSLKSAINDVLVSKEGFGGVDDVYFTSMIIQ